MTGRPLFVLKGFSKYTDGGLLIFAQHALELMTGNSNFPTPVITMAALAAIIASFSEAMAATWDGAKSAISAKDKIRGQLEKALRQLAVYVERVADGDPSIVTSAGFETRKQTSSSQPQPNTPGIRKILNGLSGELLIYIKAERYTKTYNLRYGPASIAPESWTVLQVANVKSAFSVKGLTPGVLYGFQVQALGNAGVTGWSDTFTHMSM